MSTASASQTLQQPSRGCQDGCICPDYRGFVPGGIFSSCSLRAGSDRGVLLRRLCIIVVLALRTCNTILLLVLDGAIRDFGRLAVDIVLGMVMFLSVAHWLQFIEVVQGKRKVLGVTVDRWMYDAFLLIMVVPHLGIFPLILFVGRDISSGVWLVFGLLIYIAAWTTTWEQEPTSLE